MKKIFKLAFIFSALSIFLIVGPKLNAATYVEYYNNNTFITARTEVDESVFGNSTKVKRGVYGSVKKITENNYRNSYTYLDKYVYSVFKYDKVANACVYQYNKEKYHVNQGQTLEVTYTIEDTSTTTYEASMACSLTTTVKNSSEVSGSIDAAQVKFGIDESLSATVSAEIREEKSYTHSTGLSIKNTLYAPDGSRDYAYQIRANFNVYLIKVFEINYDTNVTTHRTWYGKKYKTYEYKGSSLSEVGYFLKYEYIENSSTIGFYEYKSVGNGYYKYAGDRVEGLVYLD